MYMVTFIMQISVIYIYIYIYIISSKLGERTGNEFICDYFVNQS